MRRKVILHGPSSLGISLPSSWVKKNGIGKGAELDISESGSRLIITNSQRDERCRKTEVSFREASSAAQKDMLLALHEKGYDEITINFDDDTTIKETYRFLSESNLGYEIIRQEKGNVTLRNVTIPEDDQFNDLFNRMIRITIEFAEKINRILNEDDDVTESNMLYATSVGRIANYCRRIIVRGGIEDSVYYHRIISSMREISDSLSSLYNDIYEEERMSSEYASVFADLYDVLFSSVDLYYRFSIKRYSELDGSFASVRSRIKDLRRKQRSASCCWEHMETIAKAVSEFLPAVLALNLEG